MKKYNHIIATLVVALGTTFGTYCSDPYADLEKVSAAITSANFYRATQEEVDALNERLAGCFVHGPVPKEEYELWWRHAEEANKALIILLKQHALQAAPVVISEPSSPVRIIVSES